MGASQSLNTVRAIGAFYFCLPSPVQPALAQRMLAPATPMSARLSAEKVGDVETGTYSAGDNPDFTLTPHGDRYLLRFANFRKAMCCRCERVFLGGRILRYDTGATLCGFRCGAA